MPKRELIPARSSGIGLRRSVAKEDSSTSYQLRRKEIADAAVRVFDRLGFNGASLSAVAAELNIDRASLYYYISSKDELFDEVVRAVIERNAALAQRVQESGKSPREKLHELIAGLMVSYGDHYPVIYIYIRENLSHVSDRRSAWSNEMRAFNRQMEDAIIAMVEEGYADGSFRNIGSPQIVAFGILGMLGWTNRWFKPDKSPVDAAEVGRTFAAMALGGLEA